MIIITVIQQEDVNSQGAAVPSRGRKIRDALAGLNNPNRDTLNRHGVTHFAAAGPIGGTSAAFNSGKSRKKYLVKDLPRLDRGPTDMLQNCVI